MADTQTPTLGLPLLAAAQAQKHVTVNQALEQLDAVIQLSVLQLFLNIPPSAPRDGDRYIVGGSPTGAWAGQAYQLAYCLDGGWLFAAPHQGWLCWVQSPAGLVVFDGSVWQVVYSSGVVQNLSLLGLGTTATVGNPLSAKLNAALFTALQTTEGGTGDLRYTLNKQAAANTLSFLFQDGYSGRAEIGLCGDDNMHLKVSPNGSTWTQAIQIDRSTGEVTLNLSATARTALFNAMKSDGDFSAFLGST